MKTMRVITLSALLALAAAASASAQVRVGVGVGFRTPNTVVRVMFGTPVYYSYAPVVAYAPYPVTYEEAYLEPWPVWPAAYWDYIRVNDPYAYERFQGWMAFERDYQGAWRAHDWVRFRELQRQRWDYRNDLYRADRDFRGWQQQRDFRGRRVVRDRDDDRGGRGHDDRGWRNNDDRGGRDQRSGLWRDAGRDRHGHD